MPIKAPNNNIAEELAGFAYNIRNRIISMLREAAMKTVDAIKTPIDDGGYRSYKDRSSNLTSSIGYVIVMDGAIVDEYGFEPYQPTGIEGAEQGINYARQIASTFTEGIVVIISAGMNYAAYVEYKGLGGMTAGEQGLLDKIHKGMLELQADIKQQLSK